MSHSHSRPSSARKEDKRDIIRISNKDNKLLRDTPFICDFRFKNDLPEVPCDPKMLFETVPLEKLAEFSLTELDMDLKRDVMFEPDLGMPLSVLDVDRYIVPTNAPPLDPADLALFQDDEEVHFAASKARNRLRGSKAELSWLLRTTYMASSLTGAGRVPASERRTKAAPAVEQHADADAHILAIEETFAAAQQTPIHHKDPSLQAVEILPVLPDFERWPDNYVLVVFDNDPTADVDKLVQLPSHQKTAYSQRGQLKSFSAKRPDGTADKFVAYLLPSDAPIPEAEDGPSTSATAASSDRRHDAYTLEGNYEWIREYGFQLKPDDDNLTHLFRFKNDRVTFFDLSTRLVLRKRAKQIKGETEAPSFVRPEKVVLKRRAVTELEDEERNKKLRDFVGDVEINELMSPSGPAPLVNGTSTMAANDLVPADEEAWS